MSLLNAQDLFQDLQEEQTTHNISSEQSDTNNHTISYDDDDEEEDVSTTEDDLTSQSLDEWSSDSSYGDLTIFSRPPSRKQRNWSHQDALRNSSGRSSTRSAFSPNRTPPRRSSLSRFIGTRRHSVVETDPSTPGDSSSHQNILTEGTPTTTTSTASPSQTTTSSPAPSVHSHRTSSSSRSHSSVHQSLSNVCLPFISPSSPLIASGLTFKSNYVHSNGKKKKQKKKQFSLLDTLPMEEEEETSFAETQIFRAGGTHINEMPSDTLRLIFSYFSLNDLISCGQVCHLWYKIHRHNLLWEQWLKERNNGSLRYSIFSATAVNTYDTHGRVRRLHHRTSESITEEENGSLLLKEYYRKYKKKRKERKQAQDREMRRMGKRYAQFDPTPKQKKKNPNTSYFRTYRRIMRDKKRLKKLKKKQIKKEKLRKHYERLFRRPQKILEAFYVCVYSPLFFLAHLFSTIVLALYMDRIVPNTDWYLLMILFPVVAVDVGFFLAMLSAILTDLLSSFRRNRNFNGIVSMLYLGNVWLPVSMFLVVLKLYILPPSTPWRVAFAPLWVFCCIYSITSIILRKQIRFLKWGSDQKVMWAGTSLLNTVITLVTAFLATVLDDERMRVLIDHVYSSFVFVPIWFLLVVVLIAVPVFGYAFLHEFGFILTLLIYTPASCIFLLPWIPFFVMLAVKMDGLMDWPFIVVFSPLIFWEACSLLTSIGGAIVTRKTGLIP